jgi:hypothetical protein
MTNIDLGIMMTETQLEIAAREYCRLAGIDAEKKVGTSPPTNPDGTVNMVCLWVPAWKPVAEMIAQHNLVKHCIDMVNSQAHSPQPAAVKGGSHE